MSGGGSHKKITDITIHPEKGPANHSSGLPKNKQNAIYLDNETINHSRKGGRIRGNV